MKRIIFSLVLMLPFAVMAQQQLSGVVYDANTNTPLVGASIVTVNNKGVATNTNGEFSLACSDKITISFIGYETAEMQIADCSKSVRINLTPSKNKLDEVEITATSNSNKELINQPASIVKLDKKEINRGQGIFLDDVINANVPGVYMSRRAVASGQQFNIRGYGNGVGFKGANNNFDSQGSKVYLNGIPVTDAEGITVMDDIDFGSIGDVEVTKGPSGTLYGLAIAGVVNLETVKPEPGRTSLGQSVMFGDYGVQRYTTTFQTASERSSLLINYGHQEADGFMEHTASQKDFVNVMGEFRPSEKQKITTYFGYSNSYDERGGELTIDQYNDFDYSGNARYIKNNAHSEVIRFRAGLSHNYSFGEHIANTTTIFGSGAEMNSSSAGGWNDNHPVNYGVRSTLDFNYSLNPNFRLSGIAGLEAQQQKAQPLSYGMVTDSSDIDGYNVIGGLRSNQISNTSTYSYFTEWTLAMPMGFAFTAGVGVSNMNITLDNRVYNAASTFPTHYEANYENMISPHFALNKVFNENVSVYASYSKGYKAPVSSNIVIGNTGELNTGLKPEEGDQFEVGTKGNLMNGKLQYEVALFDAKFTNKMTSVAVPLDSVTTDYTYIANAGGQDNKGLEVLLKYTAFQSNTAIFSLVRPWANFTYSDFTYDDFSYASSTETVIYDGNAVAGVSPVTFNLGVDFNTRYGIYGNVNYNYKDAMPITSDGANMTEAFSLLNAKLGYRKTLGKHFDLEVFAGANNITGTQYYYMIFVNQLADAYLPAPYEINYYAGVNLKYVF
ncbi:TonB-dependent receptor [Owenweeksia hongkongensis]|uniref:TonB-dependent receptor n=1 Tax=Owenweeksia hongkongensis TaxID=253245 RepID=UPI003A8F93B3